MDGGNLLVVGPLAEGLARPSLKHLVLSRLVLSRLVRLDCAAPAPEIAVAVRMPNRGRL